VKRGIIITSGDPRTVAERAAEAEAAGWDGVFTYDAIAVGDDLLYDPWVTLAAMAMRTSRVTLGAMVFAPSRRRPWKLAKEAASIDILSNGRLVLPVGIGARDDMGFGNVGEATSAKARAELLDETLAILDGLGSGEPFAFAGEHYRFGPMTLRPTPVQRPRIPVWVIGAWPHVRSMRRTVRWDGIVVQAQKGEGTATDASTLRDVVDWVNRERPVELRDRPFEIVVDGVTPAGDAAAAAAIVRAQEEAGATWWIEADWADTSERRLRDRIEAGPPGTG
jgi:alkanesulfonate monooxygenase SsuD/methylene tetrahydromethanopterin reductase-like flavin-dependent oxidoreductase (luciferase family)